MSASSSPSGNSSAAGSRKRRALVCFPLKEEAAPFRPLAAARHGVEIILTGIGRENSQRSLEEALSRIEPELVLTCGFAGGLDPALSLGTVLFHLEPTATTATTGAALRRTLLYAGAKPVRFYCSPRIAVTVEEKQALRAKTQADAVDMESDMIHAICRQRGLNCATIRVISDTASEDMPLDFNALSKPDLSLDYAKLAWAIARAPWKIPALLRLQRHCRFAAQRLAGVLDRVLEVGAG